MYILKQILNGASYLFFFLLVVVGFFTVTSNTQILGNYKSWLVLSGSMEPTIMTGDIIMTKQMLQYNKNDVVTFKEGGGERVVTHRIISERITSDNSFNTKGDANRSIDNGKVNETDILGKVFFVIPKVGFLVAFSKSLPGVITLIIIPAVLLIIDQLIKMKQQNKSQ